MKAFLSHSSRDKALVEEIADQLGEGQVELDSLTFEAGLLNVVTIQDALKRCGIFVLFLTRDALASSYVRFEALSAQELMSKGLIEKFLVICLDQPSFAIADENWKSFSFVRHLTAAQPIARLIQHHLNLERARAASRHKPYVERSRELNELKDLLIRPGRPPPKAIYISGNEGIGRRTFARRLYQDRYPNINPLFPEIQINNLDGYDEIFRRLSQELSPNWPLSQMRTRAIGFSIATDASKASQIANLFDELAVSREAVFIRDAGGLLDDDGALQTPLREVFVRIKAHRHPTIVFVATRMIQRQQRNELNIVHSSLSSMSDAQIRQLAGFLLTDAGIPYTQEDLDQIIALSDGHPFNVQFLIEMAVQYTLPVALADTTELTQWKNRHGSEFLRKIQFSPTEVTIVGALDGFNALDFGTIQKVIGGDISVAGGALAHLMDLHVVESIWGDAYQIAPPLRTAVGRDKRFVLDSATKGAILTVVSGMLRSFTEDDHVSISLIDAGILASLQQRIEIPPLFSAFLLPTHLIWLARHEYDDRHWADCIRLTLRAIEGVNRLSPAARVEACRLLCLASARLNRRQEFEKGVALLRTWTGDSWARTNVHFLMGFNARLDGNLLQAEQFFNQAHAESPDNFSAIRELAAISIVRGDLDSAETFARKALDVAPDNPFMLDVLISALIACPSAQLRRRQPEIELLFAKLEQVGESEGRSFYTTRRAEYEMLHGTLTEARSLIDAAATKTPGIFDVHALRARIYLESGIKTVASDEVEIMRRVVYRNNSGERRSNLRPFLEIEASYLAACGDHKSAKDIYSNRDVFTEDEAQKEIRKIDYVLAMRQK